MLGLELVVAVCVAILIGSVIARRLGLPSPIILVVAGSLLTLVPPLHGASLPPEMVLLLFLPALLYWESLTTSLREIRRFLRGVLLNGTLLGVCSALTVALVLRALGVDWATAWIIGAALAPTDATAVAALGGGMNRRNRVVLQAESLINDGTALVIYALAVGLATGETHLGVGYVAGRFALSFGGGLVLGFVVGWLFHQVRTRLREPLLNNAAALLTPFVAYLIAEHVHASGVLAVVTAGLYAAYKAPRSVAASTRLQGGAFWSLTTFLLNGALFVLVGLQLPQTVRELTTDALGHAALLVIAAYLTLIATRLVFLNVVIALIRLVDRRPYQRTLRTTARGRMVSAVAGFRGGVSLAMALAVPETLDGSGIAFPARDLIVFVTGTVVVLTLVLQGFALPRVIRWARLPDDTAERDELRLAQVTATEEALAALPDLARERNVSDEVTADLEEEYRLHLDDLQSDGDGEANIRAREYQELRLALIARKRATVVRLRDEGAIDDVVLRQIQSRLDTEEVRLRPTPEE